MALTFNELGEAEFTESDVISYLKHVKREIVQNVSKIFTHKVEENVRSYFFTR